MSKQINVTKRNGKKEPLQIDKIHQVVEWACDGIKDVSVSEIVISSELKFYDKMSTAEIHTSLINTTEELTSVEHPNYDMVASRLFNFDLRKKVFGDFHPPSGDAFLSIFRDYIERGIYVDDFKQIDDDTINACWSLVNHDSDYNITTYGMKQIVAKYCVQSRTTKQVYETPTMAFFRISLLGALIKGGDIVSTFKEYYKQFADGDNSLPSPIMGGVGTPVKQFSSCTGIDVGDSLDSITSAATAIVRYASQRAGIGLNVGRIRAIGEPVRNGEVSHTGLIPFIQMYQGAVHAVSQGGMRKTAATLYFPIWHYEFPEMVILKDNTLIEENSARHLDYGVTVNGYLYRRLLQEKDISLFSPNVAGGELYETFASNQERFAELYEELEANPLIRRRTLSATEVFTRMLMMQRKETGRIYMVNIDHANEYGGFLPEKAPIHFSNLCIAPETKISIKIESVEMIVEIQELERIGLDDVLVKSYNIDTKEIEWKSITDFGKTRIDAELVEVNTSCGTYSLICTPDHKIYTTNRGYVEAQELDGDDLLVTEDGAHTTAIVSELERTSDVYDITVADNHNFFGEGILIHNCLEILLPSQPIQHIDDYLNSEIFLCTLANVNMARIKRLDQLERICYNMVRFLDDLLDYQGYPVPASEHWARKRRSLGIGVNNYAYWLAKQGLKYGETEALEKTHEFFEAFQYYLIKASVEVAKEKGVCEAFGDTKYSKGILPVDAYKKEVDELGNFELRMDWDALRQEVLTHGMRNSVLTALPPSETSSNILPKGSTNGIEPVRELVTLKSNRDVSGKVLAPEVAKLKNKYDLLWDQESPIGYIKTVAVIQKWVDQGISANTSYNPDHYPDGNIPMSVLMRDILQGYRWGVKTWYYQNTKKQSSTQKDEIVEENLIKSSSPVYSGGDMDDSCDACSL